MKVRVSKETDLNRTRKTICLSLARKIPQKRSLNLLVLQAAQDKVTIQVKELLEEHFHKLIKRKKSLGVSI